MFAVFFSKGEFTGTDVSQVASSFSNILLSTLARTELRLCTVHDTDL